MFNRTIRNTPKEKIIERFHNRLHSIASDQPQPLTEEDRQLKEKDLEQLFTPTEEFLKDHTDMEKDELINNLYQMMVRAHFLHLENERLTETVKRLSQSSDEQQG